MNHSDNLFYSHPFLSLFYPCLCAVEIYKTVTDIQYFVINKGIQ